MAFITDTEELKSGLVIFRRTDVKHRKWYCRIKVPKEDRYKTISLKTENVNEARNKAFDHDADVRFRVKHDVPIFGKTFEQVALEYSAEFKNKTVLGEIALRRWKIVDSFIRRFLIGYMGNIQIALIGEDKWNKYPVWRKETGKARSGGPPKDATIQQEMIAFRSIMQFAARKRYIRESQIPHGKISRGRGRREAFTPQEYRKLHTFARKWINEARGDYHKWHRTMTYNFVLIMANTGMRTMEARHLRWRDADVRTDRQGRSFVCLNVWGKSKYRELVAANNVAEYFERIRAISKAAKPDDYVFTNIDGSQSQKLYHSMISDLLKKSELEKGSLGTQRCAYCLRHTYATFRLMEGVDVYFLAKQMGTSVKMIENHYGHITPSKNAELILQGIPGWTPNAAGTGGNHDSVNADAATPKPAKKPRSKKR